MVNPPDRLLKKKCQCGEQLYSFFIVGVHLLPEWAYSLFLSHALETDSLNVAPQAPSVASLMSINLCCSCDNCGNVSFWNLNKDEFNYIQSKDRDPRYRIGWIYNPDFLQEMFSKFGPGKIVEQAIHIAKMIEKGRTGEDS